MRAGYNFFVYVFTCFSISVSLGHISVYQDFYLFTFLIISLLSAC